MEKIKYDIEINRDVIISNLKRITNQIYKLLPIREESVDWVSPLSTILEELAGMDRLLIGQHDLFFPILCKLEGLFTLDGENDFFEYRRTIFEILSLMNSLMEKCLD